VGRGLAGHRTALDHRPLRSPCSRDVTLDALAYGAHNLVRTDSEHPRVTILRPAPRTTSPRREESRGPDLGSANRNPSARLTWRFPAYAVNIAAGTVTQIRTATGTALKPITLKAGLAAIVITP